MKITDTHVYFWKGYLSQWFKSKMVDEFGVEYNCCEQFMMYRKALLFKDHEIAKKILATSNPREQKELGRLVKNYDEKKWLAMREIIVTDGNLFKFAQNESLKSELLKTENRIIVEASPFDKIWGVGLDEENPLILDEKNWQGLNLLGKCLMKVRESIYG
jgi:ribA/ribD-fused uncharacterized protein